MGIPKFRGNGEGGHGFTVGGTHRSVVQVQGNAGEQA